jgi:hypothetical protein
MLKNRITIYDPSRIDNSPMRSDSFQWLTEPQGNKSFRLRDLIFQILFVLLLLYPPLYCLHFFGEKAIFGFFAEDAFYYLTCAKHSCLSFVTFDGEMRTNGFHPLWQYLVVGLFKAVGDAQSLQLRAVFLAGVLLTAVGTAFAGQAVYILTKSRAAALWLIPGLFYVLFRTDDAVSAMTGTGYSYSCWAFMNGVETPLSVCFGGMLIYALAAAGKSVSSHDAEAGGSTHDEWTMRLCITVGLLTMLCSLARLDDAFLLFGWLFAWPYLGRSARKRLSKLAVIVGPTIIALGLYMAYNYAVGQTLVPVSGRIKSGFFLGTNALHLLQDMFPPLYDISPKISGAQLMRTWIHTATRNVGLILPAVLPAWFIIRGFVSQKSSSEERAIYRLFSPLLAYVVLKAAYNFSCVYLWYQGYWYYSLQIIIVTCILIAALHRGFSDRASFTAVPVGKLLFVLWLCVYIVTSANVIHRISAVNYPYQVWKAGDAIRAELMKIDPDMKLIDRGDGLLSYALGLPSVPITGLTADAAGYEMLKRNEYLAYCVSRGFDVLAGGPKGYTRDLKAFDQKVIYRHEPTQTVFIRLRKK